MNGLNLIVLRCRDLDSARRFYECLGMEFVRHRHGDGPEHVAAEGDTGVFEIYPATEQDGTDTTGLGFAVDELQVTADLLCAAGFRTGEIRSRPWGTSFVVRDGDGRRIEVQAR